jgi:hypothetical protein
MGVMARGIMPMAVTLSISEAHGGVHAITVTMCTTPDHRRQSMWHPLLQSLKFPTRNPNPFTPSPQLQAYPGNFTGIFKK